MDDEHGVLETSHSNYTLSVVGAVGSMLLFGFIIFIAYIPNRPGPVNEDQVEARMTTLAEVTAAQNEAATSYAWIDQDKGTVRIPFSQAMTLTAKRLGQGTDSSDNTKEAMDTTSSGQ